MCNFWLNFFGKKNALQLHSLLQAVRVKLQSIFFAEKI